MFKPTRRVEGAHRDGIWCVTWHDNTIYTGSLDGTSKTWSDELSPHAVSSQQKLGITSVSICKNSSTLVTCSQDSTISFFNNEMNENGRIDAGFLEAFKTTVSPNEEIVAAGSHSGAVNLWSMTSKSKTGSLQTKNNKFVLSTAFSPDGSQLSCTGIDGTLSIFDLGSSELVYSTDAHALPARCVKYSHGGDLLFTASDDRHVCVFDRRSGTPINSFSHTGMVLSLDTAADDRHFVVGCANHLVGYWDLGMQRCVQSFDSQHNDQVWGVSFNATGDRFVSVGDDALVQLYESTSSK